MSEPQQVPFGELIESRDWQAGLTTAQSERIYRVPTDNPDIAIELGPARGAAHPVYPQLLVIDKTAEKIPRSPNMCRLRVLYEGPQEIPAAFMGRRATAFDINSETKNINVAQGFAGDADSEIIGLDAEGADVYRGMMSYREDWHMTNAFVSWERLNLWHTYAYEGAVNTYAWRGFAAWTLLFLGLSGLHHVNGNYWEGTFQFLFKPQWVNPDDGSAYSGWHVVKNRVITMPDPADPTLFIREQGANMIYRVYEFRDFFNLGIGP